MLFAVIHIFDVIVDKNEVTKEKWARKSH